MSGLDAQLAAMPAAYAQCRDLGHTWHPHTVDRIDDPTLGYYFAQVLRCPRCLTTRTRHLDAAGRVFGGNAYGYPEGYQLAGHGRMTGDDRAALRLHTLGLDELARRRGRRTAG